MDSCRERDIRVILEMYLYDRVSSNEISMATVEGYIGLQDFRSSLAVLGNSIKGAFIPQWQLQNMKRTLYRLFYWLF
ncbi:hypothetical protein HNY73_010042 [Argiope bruennichi]|uniref:Uncharacterized protein n=1 Tax=Argiope bruennichi TaxID=94029 RepID=A0A8T0EZQ3_ARGBR|nr:hypothetical protein HNY73_010042 [Argiope bruennichi]